MKPCRLRHHLRPVFITLSALPSSATLSQLEDAMHLLKMTSASRTRGRKPNGYKPVRTVQDVVESIRIKKEELWSTAKTL